MDCGIKTIINAVRPMLRVCQISFTKSGPVLGGQVTHSRGILAPQYGRLCRIILFLYIGQLQVRTDIRLLMFFPVGAPWESDSLCPRP